MKQINELEFDYDHGNQDKNPNNHGISNIETESAFYDTNAIIYYDNKHEDQEIRYICIGKSYLNRILFISYTLRRGIIIRIISSRLANKKNIKQYESKAI